MVGLHIKETIAVLISACGVAQSMLITPHSFELRGFLLSSDCRKVSRCPQIRFSQGLMMAPEFFDREQEQKYLKKTLSRLEPYIHVMLGQPSTGKTALVRHVLSEVGSKEKHFDPLYLNLRGADISSRKSLYQSLRNCAIKAGPAWKRFGKKLTDILNVKLELGGIEVNAKGSDSLHIQDQLSELLESMPSSGRRGVLVVDEANRLKSLADADYQVSLATLSDTR
jgi:Cdc6-like AAA superfamily ATPase